MNLDELLARVIDAGGSDMHLKVNSPAMVRVDGDLQPVDQRLLTDSDLETVLLRDPTLTAGEILMSESQERMMAVVTPAKLDAFLAITTKWDVESAVIGEVTGTGRLVIHHHGEKIVEVIAGRL